MSAALDKALDPERQREIAQDEVGEHAVAEQARQAYRTYHDAAAGAILQRGELATEQRRAVNLQAEDPAETAFWEFDARHKGYSQWKRAPMSERDAFKAMWHDAYARGRSSAPQLQAAPVVGAAAGTLSDRNKPESAGWQDRDATAAVLSERGKRYGVFSKHAQVTQEIKRALFNCRRRESLAPDQVEALEMIAHKLGRIVNGDPDYDDSWVDIAGYARLVADRLQGKEH